MEIVYEKKQSKQEFDMQSSLKYFFLFVFKSKLTYFDTTIILHF